MKYSSPFSSVLLITFVLLSITVPIELKAQNSITINFSAEESGQWVPLDSLLIENLSQGTDSILYYPDTVLFISDVFIEEGKSSLSQMKVYPNPFNQNSLFDIQLDSRDFVSINVTDLRGQIICEFKDQLVQGSHQFQLNIAKSGFYILNVRCKDKKQSIKIQNCTSISQSSSEIMYQGKLDQIISYRIAASSFNFGDSLKFTAYYGSQSDIAYAILDSDQNIVFQFFPPNPCPSTFYDFRDSTLYTAVLIGNQCWMKENLAYLPYVDTAWTDFGPGIFVYFNNSPDPNIAKTRVNYLNFGALYNVPAIMNGESSSNTYPSGVQGLCPTGWHLPSVAEFDTLAQYLGGGQIAGGKMKSQSTLWNITNVGATNSSGFTGEPAGMFAHGGAYVGLGQWTVFWTSTAQSGGEQYAAELFAGVIQLNHSYFYNSARAHSIRCVKD